MSSIPSVELAVAFGTIRELACAIDLDARDVEILVQAQRLLAAIIVAREDAKAP